MTWKGAKGTACRMQDEDILGSAFLALTEASTGGERLEKEMGTGERLHHPAPADEFKS